MQTTRFLITGVGGQGTILASDVLAEVGLRLGYDAKKSDILGLAVHDVLATRYRFKLAKKTDHLKVALGRNEARRRR